MHILTKTDLIPWRGRYGPAWRYRTARGFSHSFRPCCVADGLTVDVGRYVRLSQQGGEFPARAELAFPEIASALGVQHDDRLRDSLRIMILGQLDNTEILARTGLTEELIGLWQAIFFDVNVATDSVGWQFNHIVGPELDQGNFLLAGSLHAARRGGPEIARGLLDGPQSVPSDSAEYAKLVRWQSQIAAYGLSLSPVSSREELHTLQKLALDAHRQEQKLSLRKERSASQAAREQHRLEAADRRLRLAESKSKALAQQRSDKQQLKAALDEQRRLRRRDQVAANARREQAARQARIAASELLKLPWADPGKPEGAGVVVEPATPAVTSPTPTKPSPLRSPGTPPTFRKRATERKSIVVPWSKATAPKVKSQKLPPAQACRFALEPENILSS